MSRREKEIVSIRADRSQIHCKLFGEFVILHEESWVNTNEYDDRIEQIYKIAYHVVRIKDIVRLKHLELWDYTRVYLNNVKNLESVDVIDDFNELLELLSYSNQQTNKNNQTT